MEIKTYNSAQLNDLILSEDFASMPVVPISTHRAISHIRAPRAEPDDVLLIIAYENNSMVGYLGVLADRIYTINNEAYKCGWLSCMWVDPEVRGKGIAKQLLATAFKTWNDHILVTEFTPEAKGLYDRSGYFNPLRTVEGLRCYLRFNLHQVLPKKNDKFKKLGPILMAGDYIANVLVNTRLRYFPPQRSSSLRFEQVRRVYEDVDTLIAIHSQHSFERRSTAELNWIIDYPWLIQSSPTPESRRYHFSSVATTFQNIYVKMLSGEKLVGFLHLTIRDGHLKVPYAFFDRVNTKDVIEYIYDMLLTQRLDMLTVFHPALVTYLKENATPFIYQRGIKRHYIITKALDAHFADKNQLIIQDGDADCAFT